MGRQPLFRKYFVVFVLLATGALLTSGTLELYFSYEQNKSGLIAVQREKAVTAAVRIEQFVDEIARQADVAVQPGPNGTVSLEQRRLDYARLLRQSPAITDISFLDAKGRERLQISRLAMSSTDSLIDRSDEPEFRQALMARPYFGPVHFRNDSEPYMHIGIADAGGPGVMVVELNLRFIWDVVSRIKVGDVGYAYVVDGAGQLVAHPDISRVLQKSDLSALPQVSSGTEQPSIGRGLAGETVLTANQSIPPLGWRVFVEAPLEEAFAPLYASLLRTTLLLIADLGLSVVASFLLAGRMVRPIQALREAAARIGSGALDQPIDVHTGDELEGLADEFDRTRSRLRQSYATLEARVDERTRALADALRVLQERTLQLEVASHHKSEFLANMSHELRTPLNAIIGFSDVLAEGMAGDVNDEQREFLNDILSSGRHLLALINEVLDLSKVEAGHMELDESTFKLRDVLDSGLMMVRERALRHHQTLSIAVDPSIEDIRGDQRKIRQIIFNLLSNAVKFTPETGRITVAATLVGSTVEISVHDTGIGVATDDQEHIFDAFWQARNTAHVPEGTGLGLALARRFAELHGGTLRVRSVPGRGSTFTLVLPHSAAVRVLA